MTQICPILGYHGISDEGEKYDVQEEELQEQVEWLLEEEYQILTLSEAYHKYKNSDMPEKPAVLTFDDGLRSAYNSVGILEENGVKGTFYVTSGLIGELWEGKEVMNEEEIESLVDSGHEIGAHTVSHPQLTEFPIKRMKEEVAQSRHRLEEITGKKPSSFAYPHGDFNEEVKEIVKESGFETAVTYSPRRVDGFNTPFELPRIPVQRNIPFEKVKKWVRKLTV